MPPKKKGAEAESVAKARKKKATEGPPPIADRMAAFLGNFNKKMQGRAVLKPASQYQLPYLTKRLPTGLLSLDLELRGGFPAGGLSQIIGKKNAGKTYWTWQVIRQLQAMLGQKMRVLLAMTELKADRSQARMAGVAISYGETEIKAFEKARIEQGFPPLTKEEHASLRYEVGTIHEMHGLAAEDLYDGILDAVEGNLYHLIVIDSFGNIMSAAEEETDSIHDKTYGGAAGPNTSFVKKLGGLLTFDDTYGMVRDVCILGVNQVRDDMKNQKLKGTGGHALEHAKFVDLALESGGLKGAEIGVIGAEGKTVQRFRTWGKEVFWRIEKGKAGIHEGGRGSFLYNFDEGQVDFYFDTFATGVEMGVIEANGAWYGIRNPNDKSKYLVYVQGREAFVDALKQDTAEKAASGDADASLMNFVRDQCFRKKDINVSYDWEDQK